jgi:formylglycine-generating enzyme required for sulfatase activity
VSLTWQEEQRDPPDGGSEEQKDLGTDLASPPDLTNPEDLLQREDLRKPTERPDLAKPPRPTRDMTAVMPVLPPSNPDLARGFRLPEVVSSTAPTAASKPSGLALIAEWSCPYQEWTDPKNGMVFVKVCGGMFQMGSENDPDAYSTETPSYPVKLSDYWIGKYEVSNEQYRKKEHGRKSTYDGDELPVQDVDWNEARAYCRSIGGDLPTEAEWEYAARGPEGRKYPWGNKPAPDDQHAVFMQDWDKGPEAITAKPKGRGPFGTLNQAGNVWEWVTDCYDGGAYEKRKAQSEKTTPALPVVNPVGDRSGCGLRVLRGGSFADRPRNLRSADRLWDEPTDRDRFRGFRCVRGSARQP